MIAPVALLALAAGATDQLQQIEGAIADLDARDALLAIPNAPDPTGAATALRAQLAVIERDLRQRLDQIDADDRLLTDPELRQRRSDLAVVDLRLRLPIARARLTATDPHAADADISAAISDLNAIDYAWGDVAAARHTALAALLFRSGRFTDALEHFNQGNAADSLTRLGRTACRAATDALDEVPNNPDLLEAALFAAALGPTEITASSAIAERAIATAPLWRLEAARDEVYASLRALASRYGARPPLVRIALAKTPAELEQIISLAPAQRSELAAMEAHWRTWELARDHRSLLEVALRHPNPAARHAAATHCTAYLRSAPPSERLAAKTLYDRLPDHPHRGRWLLMYAEVAPVDDALRALDQHDDPSIETNALLLAARRAYEAFTDTPSNTTAADRLTRRADAARSADHTAEWNAWLVRVLCEGKLAQSNAVEAGVWLLSQPDDDALAAAGFLAPHALQAALDAEATGDGKAQRRAAEIADRLANVAARPVIRARALTLAGHPDNALRALDAAAPSPHARLARAEALFALERDEDAFPLYRTIAESHEANRRDTDAYWRAWSRMLQIIDRSDASDRREEIAREINRLRIQDKRLGGDPHRRRLQSLLDRATPGTPPAR